MPPRRNQRPRIRTLNDEPIRLRQDNKSPHHPHRQEKSSASRIRTNVWHNASEDRKFYKEGSLTGHEPQNHVHALKRDTVYYVPLGGLEEVGRNCSFFEYNDEIIIN